MAEEQAKRLSSLCYCPSDATKQNARYRLNQACGSGSGRFPRSRDPEGGSVCLEADAVKERL